VNDREQLLLEQIGRAIAANQLLLPSLPEVAVRVREMTADPDCDQRRLEQEINKDTALAGRLIKVANSSVMQRGVPLRSVAQAIARLGLRLVCSLVTQLAILQMLQRRGGGPWLRDFVETAQAISALCRELAQPMPHLDSEQAALAGLLHDIGRLPLREFLAQQPAFANDATARRHMEDALHPTVGATLLRQWGFAEELISAVAEHEQVERDPAAAADYADLVIAANLSHYGVESGPYAHCRDLRIPALEKCRVELAAGLRGAGTPPP
jgi:putative nucleotidyltransferase with HDIG domain